MDKSVLYIGSMAAWSNSSRRYKALKNICGKAEPIDTDPYLLPKIISGMQHHLNVGPGIFILNKRIRERSTMANHDIVLVDNKSYLSKQTLRLIKMKQPSVKIVNLLTDDPFGRFSKSWSRVKYTVPFYDLFFVQREVNIGELKNYGAKNVALCYRSFDPEFNRPLELNKMDFERYHTMVGFVGTYEKERATYIAYLIQNNITVSVTGNDWPGGDCWDIIKPYYRGPSVYGEEYIKTINGMNIALHFLRHGNRDEQDSRTFEIPACKVFMLAEKSQLHCQLFKENEEAVYFASKEELLEKVKFYLSAKDERDRIAQNGYRKSFSAGYDHESRMKMVLETINDLNTNQQE